MQLLVPISSRTSFFPEADYYFPKPLIEISSKPMIQLVIEQLKFNFAFDKLIFVVDEFDCDKFSVDKLIKLTAGSSSTVIKRKGPTAGALCSALLAIDSLELEEPLIIANSDMLLNGPVGQKFEQLLKQDPDAAVFTFESIHPRWSYVLGDGKGQVLQTFEKEVVSKNAIAGTYYFKTANQFIKYAEAVILNDVQQDGNFYISSTLNECILTGGKVNYIDIGANNVASFYSPASIREFEAKNSSSFREHTSINIVIPAAGLGSRFANTGWKSPKPFIDINGQPMIKRVLENLQDDRGKYHVIVQEEHINNAPASTIHALSEQVNFITINGLTEGTACTVLKARDMVALDEPFIIANADQLIDFDFSEFVNDALERNLDGSIVVFRDSEKNPKWSFAKLNESGYVTRVAEKTPISEFATVGIYYFKSGRMFVDAALSMILENDRVNNEFYTCPVYNYVTMVGGKVGIYEIEEDQMHGLGTPTDLEDYLSIMKYPQSSDRPT